MFCTWSVCGCDRSISFSKKNYMHTAILPRFVLRHVTLSTYFVTAAGKSTRNTFLCVVKDSIKRETASVSFYGTIKTPTIIYFSIVNVALCKVVSAKFLQPLKCVILRLLNFYISLCADHFSWREFLTL